ncbi:MAG: hypothetical protein IJQ73_05680 [Kiritimatiellae bacterium]|nr:hypothetical protein [Kiritimatiellia bacterium]
MKKQVSIARALKEKNRVAGRLAKAREIIQQENSKDKSLPRRVDVEATYAEAKMLEARLVAIKSAIAQANNPIVAKIIELDELKSEIAFLNGLNVKEGRFEEVSYGNKIVRDIEAVVGQARVLAEVVELQKRADALQDALDEFNASTKVEIEIDG